MNGRKVEKEFYNWGETFDIEFDIIIYRGSGGSFCHRIVHVNPVRNQEQPGVYFCPGGKPSLGFAIKSDVPRNLVTDDYAIILNKIQHVHFRQFVTYSHGNKRFKRILEIAGEERFSRFFDEPEIYDMVTITVTDLDSSNGKVFNLKITQ